MSQSITMTIRMEPDLKDRLDQLAQATHRSKSFLATEAIREFVDQSIPWWLTGKEPCGLSL